MSRKPIFAANWKMNKGATETESFVRTFLSHTQAQEQSCDIVIAPPFTALHALTKAIQKNTELRSQIISIAAQNCSDQDSGAFTGEVSVIMLREFFVRYVILGHSERRSLFHESDALINTKVQKARQANIRPILCIGETLKEREAGKLEQVLTQQLQLGLQDISLEDMADVVLAYEPVWAIGTGLTATTEQAQSAHAFIRSCIEAQFNKETASKIRIQYGGSVKPNNIQELMACPDIDGALIGGASLDPISFSDIITAGSQN